MRTKAAVAELEVEMLRRKCAPGRLAPPESAEGYCCGASAAGAALVSPSGFDFGFSAGLSLAGALSVGAAGLSAAALSSVGALSVGAAGFSLGVAASVGFSAVAGAVSDGGDVVSLGFLGAGFFTATGCGFGGAGTFGAASSVIATANTSLSPLDSNVSVALIERVCDTNPVRLSSSACALVESSL